MSCARGENEYITLMRKWDAITLRWFFYENTLHSWEVDGTGSGCAQ
jgi:hypothetical protein